MDRRENRRHALSTRHEERAEILCRHMLHARVLICVCVKKRYVSLPDAAAISSQVHVFCRFWEPNIDYFYDFTLKITLRQSPIDFLDGRLQVPEAHVFSRPTSLKHNL